MTFSKENIKEEPAALFDLLVSWADISPGERKRTAEIIADYIENRRCPIYLDDNNTLLFYKGPAKNVGIKSDITGWDELLYMTKLEGTDIFYLKVTLEEDARIQYHFIADGEELLDKGNEYLSLHGLGALSELAMPGYKRHSYFADYSHGEEGSYEGLRKYIMPAGVLPYEHEVHVFLPAEYNVNNNYPVIYFQDGPDYIRYALAHITIQRMIDEGLIVPCIAVFVTPPNLHKPLVPNRSTEYGMNDDYVKFFCDELVPFIDENYSTKKEPSFRYVAGDSYAGLISFYIAFSRSDVFNNAYSQSGYFSFNNDSMIKYIKEMPLKELNLIFDIGTYERKVGVNFLPNAEIDFTSGNRRMKQMLESKGYNFIYNEFHEGHTWGNWRRHLIDALFYFFGKGGSK